MGSRLDLPSLEAPKTPANAVFGLFGKLRGSIQPRGNPTYPNKSIFRAGCPSPHGEQRLTLCMGQHTWGMHLGLS